MFCVSEHSEKEIWIFDGSWSHQVQRFVEVHEAEHAHLWVWLLLFINFRFHCYFAVAVFTLILWVVAIICLSSCFSGEWCCHSVLLSLLFPNSISFEDFWQLVLLLLQEWSRGWHCVLVWFTQRDFSNGTHVKNPFLPNELDEELRYISFLEDANDFRLVVVPRCFV